MHGPDMSTTPARRGGRWRTGQQSRQRILEAARERFATEGYDLTTVRAVAAAADVDAAMIYYFFGGKRRSSWRPCRSPATPASPCPV